MIRKATFIMSNTDPDKCPVPDKPEFAFIGRSNVGKSSLINLLTNNSKLAKTSGKPGKTRLINHFLLDDAWYVVDLPGYGYAKVSKTDKSSFDQMTKNYLTRRKNLVCLFVLIDSRLDPQEKDLAFLNWCGENGLPVALVFTKADKQSINKTQSVVAKFRKAMLATWEEFPPYIITSALSGTGKEELEDFMRELAAAWNK